MHSGLAALAAVNTELISRYQADLSVMLALMAARFGGKAMREVLEGNWPSMPWSPLLLCGRPFTGRTFGFVGFGRIAQGSESAALFEASGD